MKALYSSLLLLCCGLISGCNSVAPSCCKETPSYVDTDNADSIELYTSCCNDLNYQSGYYYNGYKENGWRYCIAKPVDYIKY